MSLYEKSIWTNAITLLVIKEQLKGILLVLHGHNPADFSYLEPPWQLLQKLPTKKNGPPPARWNLEIHYASK